MTKTKISKWLTEKYFILRKKFGDREFESEEAAQTLIELEELGEERGVNVILNELKKLNLLEVTHHPKDSRKVLYKLKPPIEIKEVTKDELLGMLKKAADLIRTRVNYEFILVLLFLKRLSDKWKEEYEEAVEILKKEGLSEEEAREEAKKPAFHNGLDFPSEFLWENIRKDVERLPEKLSNVMKEIAKRNPDLKDVFERVDFTQFTIPENREILRQLFEVFSERRLGKVSSDILGDAYEWIISYFAPQKAKEGEVYTPREVIRLMVEILDPKPLNEIYDPACGSGGMLIVANSYVKEKYGEEEAKKLSLFGQETNSLTIAICKMNMILHDINDPRIEIGDTLLYPRFKENGEIKKFDICLTNPPWNQDGYGEETLKKGDFWEKRFKYGFVPRQSADWAWIQHLLASTKDNGKCAIVIDNGCLFREGKEKAVRAKILEDDLIECVILLPEKLFYNTGAPGAIIIFNKNKPQKRKNKILFINASNEFIPHPSIRRLNSLSKENISKIVDAYRKFADIPGFSRVVDIKEVKNNDYNLNVTLYVMPIEEEEQIDIAREFSELKKLEEEKHEIDKKLEEYISQITRAMGNQK
ncbi:MAG: type I restriction-modification system subunit M [Candidatus Aenigmatarchaeota archaeon]